METYSHEVYNDGELRVLQVLGVDHTGVAVEFGQFGPQGFHWKECSGVSIRDDYE